MRPEYEEERGIVAGIDGTWERCNAVGGPSAKGASEQIRVGAFLLRARTREDGCVFVSLTPSAFGIGEHPLFAKKARIAEAKHGALVALRERLAEAIADIDAELRR